MIGGIPAKKFSIFIALVLGMTLAILVHDKFASAAEHSTNKLQGVAELNSTTYLSSADIIKSSDNIPNIPTFNAANLSSNIGHSENPEVVTSGTYVYVMWLDDSAGNRDVYFKRSIDNGSTFGETINISDNAGGSVNARMVASKSTGALYIIWEHMPENNGQVFFTKSNDNGATFEKPVNLANDTGLNGFPQIAISEDETKIYVVWHDTASGITLRSSTDNGVTFEKPVSLSDKDAEALNPQIHISSKIVYVVWQSNPQDRNGEIVLTRSIDNGATFEKPVSLSVKNEGINQINGNDSEQKLNSNKENQLIMYYSPQIISIPGSNEVYIGWYSGFNVLFRGNYILLIDVLFTRSIDNGATFGKPVSLTNYSVWPKATDNEGKFIQPNILSGYSGWESNLEIAASEENYVYVAWQSNPQDRNGEIVLTRSIDNGATFEKPIVISDSNGSSVDPQIAVSKDNYLYLVWQSNPQDRNWEIVLTRSIDNGATFEKPIVISDSNGSSVDPQIAISESSPVYLAWANNATGNEEIIILKGDETNKSLTFSDSIYKGGKLSNNSTVQLKSKRIALIERTFTDAAYDKAFYLFFNIKHKQDNSSKYANLLSSKVIRQYSILPEFEVIVNHLKWLTPQSNITVLTDADAHDTSSLFMDNGTIKYDFVLLGHNEYVTQQEYSNLRLFVANGGILILLDGNSLYTEVRYDEKNENITLVKGHGEALDRGIASHSVDERWADETAKWTGGIYCLCDTDDIRFKNNPFGARHNEEHMITNSNVKILLDYKAYNHTAYNHTAYNHTGNESDSSELRIATYELSYKKGKVITMGLYTDDLLFFNDKFKRFFDSLLFYYGLQAENPTSGATS